MKKILFIIGSLRKESFNRQLVLEAENRDIRKDAPGGFS
jgi:NAD(P)H-dependent FMN reductase